MERSNLEKYYLSIAPIKEMFTKNILSKDNYLKAEVFLTEKYCIKKGNLYRLNDLTIPSKRVIYRMSEEEVYNDEKNSNQSKHVTQIRE